MPIPDSPLRKAINNPVAALRWTKHRLPDVFRSVTDRYVVTPNLARYLFDFEWDLAVILDACRFDVGVQVVASHPIELGPPTRVYSAGSWSPDWIGRTFGKASAHQLASTRYISANVYTNEVPSEVAVDRVWRYGWDEEIGTVPPRPVTDRTIERMRTGSADRYIAHYMQPHLPPVARTELDFREVRPYEGSPERGRGDGDEWEFVRRGMIDPAQARAVYRANLTPVLDDLELLLANVDAERVIVTADHGNYLGEHGRWGHPAGHILPAVRHVPWWTTSAVDSESYTPSPAPDPIDVTRDERLERLGYR